MIFSPKTIALKDGRQAILRSPDPVRDAEAMLTYIKTCAAETEFILRYPEECTETLEQEITFLNRFHEARSAVMIACELEGRIVGNCQLSGNRRIKTAHRASIGIAMIREVWGLGIGTAMFREMLDIARQWEITQLELEYIEGNERGRRLYEKMGFVRYGCRPDAIRLRDGSMRDEILMLCRLNADTE